ncbi:MAG: hypothetical protein U0794_10600 [Isosphaeraceae bacterium]
MTGKPGVVMATSGPVR